ncbi:hypothetical protein DI272_16365 [Streptomyces sp. Act143]|uniref:hypothetical protein n=1 Tax=Streptomyces sp. Act143 TaxID=2200760 RepID=UPI000D67FC7D|nr:hypothetical protein [Streptomyces sp. Act143]PWI15570.1 hypothetical protein DI272_16365 [Streptomyces sp. Act143]
MNHTPSAVRRRLLAVGIIAVSTALAVAIAARLSGYGVPVLLVMACGAACLSAFCDLLFRVADAAQATTHRCTQPGCDFHVRLTNVDAAESRRWQEIAATHPHHTR